MKTFKELVAEMTTPYMHRQKRLQTGRSATGYAVGHHFNNTDKPAVSNTNTEKKPFSTDDFIKDMKANKEKAEADRLERQKSNKAHYGKMFAKYGKKLQK